jgi:Spy/CpxP family protein refolding chaperone
MKIRNAVLTAVAVALIACATLAVAQVRERGFWGHDDEMMADGPRGVLGPIGRMLDRLDLTDEQRAKVEAILDEARPNLQALHRQLHEGREAFTAAHPPETFDEAAIRAHAAEQNKIRTDLAVVAAKTRARALAVLTPEQLSQFKEMRTHRHERMGRFAPDPDE